MFDEMLEKFSLLKNSNENESMPAQEVQRIKYLSEIDEIVGISEMNESDTQQYLVEKKIPIVKFIIDEEKSINNRFKLNERYEMLVVNGQIEEYRKDPTNKENIAQLLISIQYILYFIISGIILIKASNEYVKNKNFYSKIKSYLKEY